jgi:glycosyltransferase involved in cell wall biosynthesis
VNRPLASVIMPVRNGERFLSQAIESVLGQSYRPIEIVLVDGQSTDRTAAIARSYPEVRYLQQADRSVGRAYNMGIEAASGDFLAFLSHDDLWTPDKLGTQIDYLIGHPETLYTVARAEFFLEPGCAPPAGFRPGLLQRDWPAFIMETLVARREAFRRVGMLDPELSSAEDVDWFARARDLGMPMAVIDRVLLRKRIHERNNSLVVAENTRNLLAALRRSVARKRGGGDR